MPKFSLSKNLLSLARRDASTSLSMTCQKSGSWLTRFECPSDYELNRKTSFPIV